jgi:AbrB family looped-hinge helix DNA binding protein
MERATMSSRGRVVLPRAVRRRLGLTRGQRFAVDVAGGDVVLRPLMDERRETVRPGEGQPDWRRLRGCLRGTDALGRLLADHRDGVARGR